MFRPSARIGLAFQGQDRTRLNLYGYGDDPRVPNPGDLLVTAGLGDADGALVELTMLIHGRDMAQLAAKAATAAAEYATNSEWLAAPVTRPGVA